MLIFFKEWLLQIIIWSLNLIDKILEIFSHTISLDTFWFQFDTVNSIEYFLEHSIINNLFSHILILTIIFIGVFSIITIIKTMITDRNTLFNVIGKFLLAIFSIMIVLLVATMAIILSNVLFRMINNMFNIDATLKISNLVFELCVDEWLNDYSINEIDFNTITIDKLFGDYVTNNNVFPIAWQNNGMINPEKFLFLPGIITTIIILFSFLFIIIKLIKRIYEVILLYLIMPISVSTIPLDNGERLKKWTECFINKLTITHVNILTINLYHFMLPIVLEFTIPNITKSADNIFKLMVLSAFTLSVPLGQKLIGHILKRVNNPTNNIFNLFTKHQYLPIHYYRGNSNHRFSELYQKGEKNAHST